MARKKPVTSEKVRNKGHMRAKLKFWGIILIAMAVTGGALYFYYSYTLSLGPQPYQAIFRLNITLANPDNTSQVKGVYIPSGVGVFPSLWIDHRLDKYGVDGRAPLYTLDSSGIVRIQSNAYLNYTLGDFFTIWGQFFNGTCLHIDRLYCDSLSSGSGMVWGFYVNGQFNGNFGAYIVKDQDYLRLSYAAVA
ncbi:hypothetical protein E6H34_05810 [Candidatus Bathyarchaeota archaeon]|nr:MAG: hypothetical protein E6H34_05810 [Candidatus Bathyarchaeota archaeon]